MTTAGQARPVSGPVSTLRRGAAWARVGTVAAVLRGFGVGDIAYTETWADDELPPMGCGIVLVPWPNRVAGGRWQLDGRAQQLDLTEPGRGNATHGLLRNTAYTVLDAADEAVTHAATIYPQHGYPFTLDTTVTHRLTDDGLQVTHTVTNVGAAGTGGAPFGVGAHPYLRVGDVPVDDLVITVAAATTVSTDERLIPVERVPVEGSGFDLRSGVRIGDLDADTAFTDLTLAASGRYEHRLVAPDGRGVLLWAEPDFGWAQVFTPKNFPVPGRADARRAVSVEPMTCSADALNNGWGLRWLAPGETWSGSWGISPTT